MINESIKTMLEYFGFSFSNQINKSLEIRTYINYCSKSQLELESKKVKFDKYLGSFHIFLVTISTVIEFSLSRTVRGPVINCIPKVVLYHISTSNVLHSLNILIGKFASITRQKGLQNNWLPKFTKTKLISIPRFAMTKLNWL